MSISWDVTEINHLAADIATAATRIGAPVAAVVRTAAKSIETDAKRMAPVGETGNLRDSISTTLEGDGRSGTMSAEIGPTAFYGAFVEYGTSEMPPEPYMGPAFESNIDPYVHALELAMGEIL